MSANDALQAIPHVMRATDETRAMIHLVIHQRQALHHLLVDAVRALPVGATRMRRIVLADRALSCLDADDDMVPVSEGYLCINDQSGHWWLEGGYVSASATEQPSFFVSEVNVLGPLTLEKVS